MLNVIASHASEPNRFCKERARKSGESNVDWVARNLPEKAKERMTLLLVGGVDALHLCLRSAQGVVRHDTTPSHWSQVALLDKPGKATGRTRLYEVALDPPGGFGHAPSTNAIQDSQLRRYADPEEFPNLAVAVLPIKRGSLKSDLDRLRHGRGVIDLVDSLLAWLAYAWGVGRAPNPLHAEIGMPGASLVEGVLAARDFDLTPGLESRSSCPEAIWQSVRWWHEYHSEQAAAGGRGERVSAADAVGCSYVLGNRLG